MTFKKVKFLRNQNINHIRVDIALRCIVKKRKLVDEKLRQNCNKNQDQNEGGKIKGDKRHRITLGFFQVLTITLFHELKVRLFLLKYMEIVGQIKFWQSRLHRVRGGEKKCQILDYVLNQQKQYIRINTINIKRNQDVRPSRLNRDLLQRQGNLQQLEQMNKNSLSIIKDTKQHQRIKRYQGILYDKTSSGVFQSVTIFPTINITIIIKFVFVMVFYLSQVFPLQIRETYKFQELGTDTFKFTVTRWFLSRETSTNRSNMDQKHRTS